MDSRLREMVTAAIDSILEEIHLQRIEQAKKLIRNPATKLSMVASMCGFKSNPFFVRVFKRTTGLTMQEWRNLNH